ncbi:molybdopterin-guanine dinucleotide biosynthesis protein B [Alkaliphilus metalliredigens QYMF]|uniref:Molybdopterin-guanine dinucleotide biosynthesis protein B n=1 Tax=Alkaliphilus metalliredigens (strain QYMF) TaxID=293826 RepID=A6TLZ6_ALKMQ|nr:molybdopterin-guanine dinucleotide biosynthesis protein B [Alkaliphilus metalliredigens]ABR47214.1 molybdopterin-guanine dinucleotide biosynthesis protein B [Alkaliphilus metalliredigens QYMF]
MIPVFSIVGKNSNTGKTTVLCNIIGELKARGYRVATIKHDVHGFDIDHPGKDTWKHGQAGSDIVMISSPEKFAMIEKVQEEYTLDEILEKITNVDIVITEGYKRENKPKLEVFRSAAAKELLCEEHELFALVTDVSFEKSIPQFSFEEISQLVDLIEARFLQK